MVGIMHAPCSLCLPKRPGRVASPPLVSPAEIVLLQVRPASKWIQSPGASSAMSICFSFPLPLVNWSMCFLCVLSCFLNCCSCVFSAERARACLILAWCLLLCLWWYVRGGASRGPL